MRIRDLVPKTETSYSELVMQVVAALLISWCVSAMLSGCTTIDAAKAYSIIQGVK